MTPDAELFAKIARLLDAEPNVASTLEQITEQARQALACDYAGVTLRHSGNNLETAAPTDEIVVRGDDLQYKLGEGPCVQAIWSHEAFLSEDLEHDPRWPSWGPRAAALGLRSALAVRLFSHERTYGALNLYGGSPRQFTPSDLETAQVFAAHAALALATAHQMEHLVKAIDARNLIGQAQGILMQRFDIDANRAFDVLRRYSSDRNVKLRDIAQEVIDNRGELRQPHDGHHRSRGLEPETPG
ncbi:MAG TPA: GAF and ANTAR domain-containing protein [Nocardioidaceae bacterium]|jgi:GAF domain-containing protein